MSCLSNVMTTDNTPKLEMKDDSIVQQNLFTIYGIKKLTFSLIL